MNRKKLPPEQRFWKLVTKTETCWIWQGFKDQKGYGRFHRGIDRNGNILAHRFSYELAYGELPLELAVCHKCDNPSCVRPDHLFLGTRADNNRDMVNKGRYAKGEGNGQAKLTLETVRKIRSLYRPNQYGYVRLSRQFDVSMSNIRSIIKNQTWIER